MLRITSYKLWVYDCLKFKIKVESKCYYYFMSKQSFSWFFSQLKNYSEWHYETSCRVIYLKL